MSKLIVIGGWAMTGKDAAADYLVGQVGYTKHFMSRPLNECLMVLNPVVTAVPTWDVNKGVWGCLLVRYAEIVNEIGYTKAKELFPEIRDLLIRLGTEVGRNMIDEDIWTRIASVGNLYDDVMPLLEEGKDVVVTGMRYHNELEVAKELGGQSWWVERPGYGPVRLHSSELTLGPEDFDHVLVNDGSLEQLYKLAYQRQLAVV